MQLVCLDLEGVLVPEIWMAVAEKTGVEALRRTTRDEPDYDVLMRYRLDLLARHRITLPQIQEVIGTLAPLEGAAAFLEWLRSVTQVVILSDTFAEFAQPLMRQLSWPTLLCHSLEVQANGAITGYRLRQPDPKLKAVRAFQSLNLRVLAAGDSYNDLSMLLSADAAVLFRPPDSLAAEQPQLPVTRTHAQLREALATILNGNAPA
ncbi:MAG: bifunctional phosphoserine phosphatase/homoserine phosphotransferase ThrH [Opitutales bacterium]